MVTAFCDALFSDEFKALLPESTRISVFQGSLGWAEVFNKDNHFKGRAVLQVRDLSRTEHPYTAHTVYIDALISSMVMSSADIMPGAGEIRVMLGQGEISALNVYNAIASVLKMRLEAQATDTLRWLTMMPERVAGDK